MNTIDTRILSDIVYVIVAVAITLITRYFIPWIKSKIDTEKVKKIGDNINLANEIAHTLVEAAEQTIKGQGKGKLKKAEVMTALNKVNKELGLNVSEKVLDAIVESTVKAMNDYADSNSTESK